MSVLKLMVIDTHGGQNLSARYRKLLPHVVLRGYEPASVMGTPCHPHGLQAGYYAGVLLHEELGVPPGMWEIIFVRIFDEQARMLPGSDTYMLSVIARERPHIITRSWGGVYGKGELGKATGMVMWGEWVEAYRKLQREIGFIDFGSAGNSGDWKRDDDTGYPQRMMPDICNLIGSCRRDGYPSEFTSDGPDVQCVAWADRIWLPDGRGWSLGSGTSFSCPKMAGLCAWLGIDTNEEWRAYVEDEVGKPKGYEASWKWGKGELEEGRRGGGYQTCFKGLPVSVLPPDGSAARPDASPTALQPRWFDFWPVSRPPHA